MIPLFSAEIAPDPFDARDVLAFVFCPPGALVPVTCEDELAAVAELLAPAKALAVRRWYDAHLARLRN